MTRTCLRALALALAAAASLAASDDPFVGDFVLRGTEDQTPIVVELQVRKDAAGAYSVVRSARYASARDGLFLVPASRWRTLEVTTRPSKAGPLLVVDYTLPTLKATAGLAGTIGGKPGSPPARYRGIYRVTAGGELEERAYAWEPGPGPRWSQTRSAGRALPRKLADTLEGLRGLAAGLDVVSERAGRTPIRVHGFAQRGGLSPEGIARLLNLESVRLTRGEFADEAWRGEVDPAAPALDPQNQVGFARLFTSFQAKVVRPGVFYLGGDEGDGGTLLGEFEVVFYGQTPAGDLILLEAPLVETP